MPDRSLSMKPTHPQDVCRLYIDHKDGILKTLKLGFDNPLVSDQDLEEQFL